MSDAIYIEERKAMRILMGVGDFTESQARIVLGHSLKQDFGGATYYPLTYIEKRAADNAARNEEDSE